MYKELEEILKFSKENKFSVDDLAAFFSAMEVIVYNGLIDVQDKDKAEHFAEKMKYTADNIDSIAKELF
jgi:hypothetical protein